jgi:hypothetical protein
MIEISDNSFIFTILSPLIAVVTIFRKNCNFQHSALNAYVFKGFCLML